MIETQTTVPIETVTDEAGVTYPLRHFELFEEIGRGGMGVVYKARQTNAGDREVAVKTLHPDRAQDRRLARWFLREVRATLNLNHPNVVMAIEADQFQGMPYLAMEFVDGPSLADLLRMRGTLPVPIACSLFAQIASGLRHAHEQGFLHRDIKPSNVLLRADGIAKLCDFGITSFQGDDTIPVEFAEPTTSIAGTPGYMAPEQMDPISHVTSQVDIYSFGATFHHTLFGVVPSLHAESGFSSQSQTLPPGIAELGKALLEPNPENRPTSINEIINNLKIFSEDKSFADTVKECGSRKPGRCIRLTDLPPPPKPNLKRKVFLGLLGASIAAPAVYAVSRLTGSGDRAGEPAGAEPFLPFEELAAEEIEARRKYPLFGKAPEHYWGNPAEAHLHVDHDPAALSIKVDSLSLALLRCCEIPFDNFDLEVTIIQKSVLGGFGLFFYAAKSGEDLHYESLKASPAGERAINLLHQRYELTTTFPDIKSSNYLVVDLQQPRSVTAEYHLKVQARFNYLHRTLLNGTPALSHPREETLPPEVRGHTFGILVNGRASTFKDAYISVW